MKTTYQAITFMLLGAWLLKLFVSNDLAVLILPRYNILIIISAITLIIASLLIFIFRKKNWHEISNHTKYTSLVVLISIIIIEFSSPLGLTSSSAIKRGVTDLSNVKISKKLNLGIKSTQRSFGDWVQILKSSDLTESEQGSELIISGFVYNDDAREGGTLLLSRFLIRCCAADAQFISIPVKTDLTFPNDQWVEIKGYIEGSSIKATELKEINTPKIQYIN